MICSDYRQYIYVEEISRTVRRHLYCTVEIGRDGRAKRFLRKLLIVVTVNFNDSKSKYNYSLSYKFSASEHYGNSLVTKQRL
jgi:hypothetical protein